MAEAKVYISGPIVADSSEAGNAYPYCTVEDVMMQLEYQKPYDTVRAIINSPGGRVDKGMGVYDLFRSLPNVTIITEAIGQCSSIATAVFLAGSQRIIHPHTESLVHLPVGGINGANAEQAQAWADEMARCEADLLALYVERAGIDPTTFTDVMRAATVLTAQQMLDYGFATQIVQPATALAIMPSLASTSSTDDQTPGWAQQLMSKFNQALAAMTAAVRKPATAQAPEVDEATALQVTTDSGTTLDIETGERTTYEVGDEVTSDGTTVADDDYLLNDGNTITVVAGAITAVTPPDTTSATASAETDGAMTQVIEAITALGTRMSGMETRLAAQAKVVNRVAATAGSSATPARAAAAGGDDKDTDVDPVKTASEARAARRAKRYAS